MCGEKSWGKVQRQAANLAVGWPTIHPTHTPPVPADSASSAPIDLRHFDRWVEDIAGTNGGIIDHAGNCQCGRISFTVTGDFTSGMECN